MITEEKFPCWWDHTYTVKFEYEDGKNKHRYVNEDGNEGTQPVSWQTKEKGIVYDVPQNDPVTILLKKVDTETGGSALGGATLAGAQFTVRYYDTTDATSLSKDYAERARSAKKTWVYETDEKGRVNLQTALPVTGDVTYKAWDGKTTCLPIGTYVIEETKAPTGYLLPECQNRTYIEVVTAVANSTSESIETYHHETYVPIDNKIFKQSDGTEITYQGLKWTEW